MAQLHRGPGQHGHVCLAPAPRHRLLDEPIRREHPRPVRQRSGCPENSPASPTSWHEAHALRGLWRGRLGSPIRGHETHRRLARSPRRQHPGPASLLCDDSRRAQTRSSPVLLLPRTVVERLPRLRRIFRPALRRPLARRANQQGARARADHHRLDVSGRRRKAERAGRQLLQAPDGPGSGPSRIRHRQRRPHREARRCGRRKVEDRKPHLPSGGAPAVHRKREQQDQGVPGPGRDRRHGQSAGPRGWHRAQAFPDRPRSPPRELDSQAQQRCLRALPRPKEGRLSYRTRSRRQRHPLPSPPPAC